MKPVKASSIAKTYREPNVSPAQAPGRHLPVGAPSAVDRRVDPRSIRPTFYGVPTEGN